MDGDSNIIINYIEKPELKNVTFIEGLPGIGNVGKLAAEHLIDEVGAKKFMEIYSFAKIIKYNTP